MSQGINSETKKYYAAVHHGIDPGFFRLHSHLGVQPDGAPDLYVHNILADINIPLPRCPCRVRNPCHHAVIDGRRRTAATRPTVCNLFLCRRNRADYFQLWFP